jgi:cysteine desulfurase / selenocysteine lyase
MTPPAPSSPLVVAAGPAAPAAPVGSPTAAATPAAAAFDAERRRADFPLLAQRFRGRRLVYLDSAASAQKPQAVIDAVAGCYRSAYANIHRGLYELAQRVDAAYEGAREKVRVLLNAADRHEIVFTRGTTEAINLVANSFARPRLTAGDEVLITALEHHSNIVPWQLACEATGARLRVAPIDDAGDVVLEEYAALLGPRTRLAALGHVSNALGTVNPLAEMIALARERGVPVLVDGAQAVPHGPVDVQALGCDFYAFSSHKAFGPSGVGVLYGRRERLAAMPPWQGGGDMIRAVSFAKTTYADPPARFEAGTPNIEGAVGLGAAIDYLTALDAAALAAHEAGLLAYAVARLAEVPGVRVLGAPRRRSAVVSFVHADAHPHDVATVLADEGVAVRAGHHCAQPLMARLGVPATTRASFALYNTRADVDALATALVRVGEIFAR